MDPVSFQTDQEISLHGLWTATGRLEGKLDRVLAHPGWDVASRFAKHLLHERPYIFTLSLLSRAGCHQQCQRASYPRPHRRAQKLGRQSTPRGARAQAVLTSILQTAKQQGKKTFEVLVELLCGSEKHKILDLVPAREIPLEPVTSSRHSPPPFAVPDIIWAQPSAGVAAAPV